ncbi:MAG TPA: hypothetical protein VKS22_12150 [Candidatus Binataceae bacterium]|nr:hypothetical protein [Candidatus Binataceae bacterium]
MENQIESGGAGRLNGNGKHLNGSAASAGRPTGKGHSATRYPDFTISSLEQLAAWTGDSSKKLRRAIFVLVRSLGELEEGADLLRQLSQIRRYRGIWRLTSEPAFHNASRDYHHANQRAIDARDQIQQVSMDLVRHCAVLAGPALEETANLARLLDLANEVTASFFPPTMTDTDDLQAGLDADVYVSRALHLSVVLEDEAKRIAKYACRHRARH